MKKRQCDQDIISKAFDTIPPENKQFVSKNLDISQRVYELMAQKGWDKNDLANEMGTNGLYIECVLSGLQDLNLRTITDMEVALGADIIITTKTK